MSTSYQDIDVRVRGLEEMVLFLMTSMRMQGVVGTGVLGADGKPQGKVIDGNMLDFYRLAKANSLNVEPVYVEEEAKVNG